MIEVKDLSIKYGKKYIFKNFDIKLDDGKIIGIIAPSGTGKTTLINAICGILRPQSGEVYIDGVKLPSLKIYDKISIMPQENGLYENLSGKSNLVYFTKINKINLDDKQINDLFLKYDIFDEKNTLVANYSGGMKRKLSLMITVATNASVLFLDEPTVGIDPVQKKVIWNDFRNMQINGKTLIVTTHVMEEASRCDEIILLGQNKIIERGTLAEILAKNNCNTLEDVVLKLSGGYNE